jgi:hypothetical protein
VGIAVVENAVCAWGTVIGGKVGGALLVEARVKAGAVASVVAGAGPGASVLTVIGVGGCANTDLADASPVVPKNAPPTQSALNHTAELLLNNRRLAEDIQRIITQL